MPPWEVETYIVEDGPTTIQGLSESPQGHGQLRGSRFNFQVLSTEQPASAEICEQPSGLNEA